MIQGLSGLDSGSLASQDQPRVGGMGAWVRIPHPGFIFLGLPFHIPDLCSPILGLLRSTGSPIRFLAGAFHFPPAVASGIRPWLWNDFQHRNLIPSERENEPQIDETAGKVPNEMTGDDGLTFTLLT